MYRYFMQKRSAVIHSINIGSIVRNSSLFLSLKANRRVEFQDVSTNTKIKHLCLKLYFDVSSFHSLNSNNLNYSCELCNQTHSLTFYCDVKRPADEDKSISYSFCTKIKLMDGTVLIFQTCTNSTISQDIKIQL